MNPPGRFQAYQRMIISKMPHRFRRLVVLTCVLVLFFVTLSQNFQTVVLADRMGFMYAEIGDFLRADPASIRDRYLQTWRERMVRPDGFPYNLSDPSKIDFSRGQSRVVLALTDGKTKGFYVEVGGGDGETNSVTLALELQAQWEGVLVEGDPIKFKQLLAKHRRATCLHARISYSKPTGSTPSNLDLLPSDLFQVINRTNIDLLRINLHGQELDFLWSVNFHLHTVKIVIIEMQGDVSRDYYMQLTSVLTRRGYRVSHHIVDGKAGKKDVVYARD